MAVRTLLSATTVLLVIILLAHESLGKCPQPEALIPCVCDHEQRIICSGSEQYSLRTVFQQISSQITDEKDKQFTDFLLDNQAITEIEDNVFFDLKFRRIFFHSVLNLNRIRANAFNSTADTVVEFYFESESQIGSKPEYDTEFFQSMGSLYNLQKLVIYQHKLTAIPAHAFKNSAGKASQLWEIYFTNSHDNYLYIRSIAEYAFYELSNIAKISMFNHQIDHIPLNSFAIQDHSNHTLSIYLNDNRLNSSSIEPGSFTNTNRPILLFIAYNPIDTLDQSVFMPIFEANPNNRVYTGDNPFNCDCRMKWLLNNNRKLITDQRLLNAVCVNTGRNFSTLSDTDFANCI